MKQYTLDTNVFRHKTNGKNDNIQPSAKHFWTKVIQEITQNEAVLLVPKEVIRELEVQSFTLSDSKNQKISQLLKLCIEVNPKTLNDEIEHCLRKMAACIRKPELRQTFKQLKVEGLKVSDARILYTAYTEDSILVTANVKDFMLYPLLFEESEERLYCLKNNKFITVPAESYEKIHEDETFKSLFKELTNLEFKSEGTQH